MIAEVREEWAGDAEAIRSVHLAAFPTANEADLVDQLRRDGDIAVSLVAVEDGAVVGHVLFSRMFVEADRREFDGLGLGPIAVLPDRQRSGIGSALIEAGVERAQSAGAQIIFVLGEPDYYGRFGFDAGVAAPFASPYAGPYLQARLLDGLRPPCSGRADYAPAFAGL